VIVRPVLVTLSPGLNSSKCSPVGRDKLRAFVVMADYSSLRVKVSRNLSTNQ
jgi:hypothetical protein